VNLYSLRNRTTILALALAVGASAVMAQNGNGNALGDPGNSFEAGAPTIVPHGVNKTEGQPTKGSTAALSPITAHGGPVMGTPTPYLIWYGNWSQSNGSDNSTGQQIVRDFLYGDSNSAYFALNTTYKGPNGTAPTGAINYSGIPGVNETTVSGTGSLSDNGVATIVSNAINSGKLGPKDPNGIYFVLTSSDINKTGFCSQYCGWHTHGSLGGTDIKYSFVGNANRCLSHCAAQTTSPNSNAGVDGMVSVIAHELEEATTDPDLNAWYDSSGAENADKCAWTFGQNQSVTSNGAYYNQTLPKPGGGGATRNYLIQRNLSSVDNRCYLGLNGAQ
jgi:hypothetical protein